MLPAEAWKAVARACVQLEGNLYWLELSAVLASASSLSSEALLEHWAMLALPLDLASAIVTPSHL